MTGNISYLSNFKEINRGYVAFGGNPKGGKITCKVKIRRRKLDFDDVSFVKELKFNLFSVSQMCDKKNNVLFTDTKCIVLCSDFKLPDENHVLLRVSRENNMYNVDLKNIVPSGNLTCLFAKATLDESNLWHKRLGHINFKTMNKLVKGKQHRASCKSKPVNSVSQPLQRLHMDLFGPTFVKSLNKKSYCLVVTDDYSRVLVTKPHNKTPYELLLGRTPSIRFIRPFGCPVTILNTLDPLGKFDRKADEGFLVEYSVSSKAFRVFNSRTRIVQETLHINFLENQPNVAGSGPTWLFDIDTLTQSMNYQPVVAGNQPNSSIDPQNTDADATFEVKELESEVHVSPSSSDKTKKHDEKTKREAKGKSLVKLSTGFRNLSEKIENFSSHSTNRVNAASTPVTTVEPNSTNSTNSSNVVGPSNNVVSSTFEICRRSSFMDPSQYTDDPNMSALEDITYSDDEEAVGIEDGFSNLETSIPVSHILTTRVHKDHPVIQIIGDLSLAPQTRRIKREFNVARTPQQNGVVERKNRTLIEAARTKLANSLLPIPFWAEAVNTACYVQNRVLVTKPHNKTPYELLLGRSPSICFMRPFGCPFNILNTLDPLGKFDGKVDEGFFVGYSVNSKAFRVFNSRTRIVQEILHISFLENNPNVARIGPKWLFDIDTLTQSINNQPVVARNQPNHNADADVADAAFDVKENEKDVQVSPSGSDKPKKHNEKLKEMIKERVLVTAVNAPITAVGPKSTNSTNSFNTASPFDTAVKKLMKEKFQMSSMGELTFFLGKQVKQKEDEIFISQDKYVAKISRKFGLTDGKSASTPIDTKKPLLKDFDSEDVDVHTYRLIITAVSSKLMLFGLTIDAAHLMLLEDEDNTNEVSVEPTPHLPTPATPPPP
nr:ribonuclease H-like domain-containing protein [Tanacetum cinerariifolium]